MTLPLFSKITGFVAGNRVRVERRAVRRLTPGHLTPCQIRPPGGEPRPAWVHNLSLRGAGVLADREYPPGTRVGLLVVNAAHTFALSVQLDVVRCFRVVNGDYFVGGRFARQLGHDELLPFMV